MAANSRPSVERAGDRDKALETALVQIERQFGKGSVMRLGQEGHVPVEVIPTGSISLDVALGIGGLPRGRIVEIYGPESSGKCATADTYVWTDRGLETIAEVFARCGEELDSTPRITDIRHLGVRMVNERRELERVAALTHNGNQPVRRFRLRSGRTLTITHNHPLRVLSERGFIIWRTAGQIRPGDIVVSAAFGGNEAACGDGLSEDEAIFLGYLVAEGSLSARNEVRFTNTDPEVAEEYTKIMRGLFDVTVKNYHGVQHVVHSTALRKRLEKDYGLDYVTAAGKKVPACIRTGGHKAQRAFLSALFEGDGWIDPTSTIGLGTASEELARQVQLMLYGLGIPATVSSKHNAKYARDYWAVTVNPSVAGRFLTEVGFRSARRRAQVEKCFKMSPRDPQFENIPHLAGLLRDLRDDCGGDRAFDRIAGDLFRPEMNLACSRQRLAKIVGWCERREDRLSAGARTILHYLRVLAEAPYTYEDVVTVEDAGLQPTFDVVLPETHSFLANGVLSHNTTVALHAVANAQRAGGIAAFIDAEHALDPDYAKKLGVDTDQLLVSQPDTGEQALEIMDMLIRSGAIDIIVVNSVAALVPKAEIEGEMGDSHVGLQARLMSQALRKITGALNQAKTTAIFTNQLREKVGVMFGSPETTSGGKALKFYASVRLDVRRIETLKDGTDAVGNRTRAKVVKNKCLAEGTRVFDPATGLTHRIEEIVDGRLPVHVVSADKNGELSAREVKSWFDQGEQEVIGVRLRDNAELWVTPDHKILTERGWRLAGELARGDRVARPRSFLGFGSVEPVPPDHARLLGYLIGDGYVGGKTPVQFINMAESLQQDAARIAATLGCEAKPTGKVGNVAFSHRPGEKNGVLDLCRWAGIHGCLAPTKKVPPEFFDPKVSAGVVSNLVFGYFESDGYVSREQTGGIRIGFSTTSEQLAWQIHWLLLRWSIGSSVQRRDPRGQRGGLVKGRRISGKYPSWEVRVSGVENVSAFADAIPMWGPRGQVVTRELAVIDGRYRGSQRIYLSGDIAEPVLGHLERRGVTPLLAAQMIGESAGDPRGGMKVVLGNPRMRRDRLQRLADALDDPFLDQILADQLWFSPIREVLPARRVRTFDVEAADLHNLVAEDVVVHNCAPPFKVAEFDILYGVGISREGSLIDLGVEQGIVRKAGAWYTYEGDQLGQGKENARTFLKENTDIANEIEKKIKEKLGVGPRLDAAPGVADTVPAPARGGAAGAAGPAGGAAAATGGKPSAAAGRAAAAGTARIPNLSSSGGTGGAV